MVFFIFSSFVVFFFQNLLKVHDQLSENAVFDAKEDPVAEDYPFKDYGEGAVKIVHLEKTTEPLVSLRFKTYFH